MSISIENHMWELINSSQLGVCLWVLAGSLIWLKLHDRLPMYLQIWALIPTMWIGFPILWFFIQYIWNHIVWFSIQCLWNHWTLVLYMVWLCVPLLWCVIPLVAIIYYDFTNGISNLN